MAMNTYPLEQACALVITPEVACAILIKDAYDDGGSALPGEVLEAMESGRTAFQCATDPAFREALMENDWFSVSDAHDLLESDEMDNMVYCSEFEGEASPASDEGFGDEGSEAVSYDDDYIAYLQPENAPSLFRPAYASKEELVQEYKNRLSGYLDDDFPYGRFIMNVSGTYVC